MATADSRSSQPRKRAPNARNSKARNILDLGSEIGCKGIVVTGGLSKCVREIHHNLLAWNKLNGHELGDALADSEPPAKKMKLEDEVSAEVSAAGSKMATIRTLYPSYDIPCGKNIQFIKFTQDIPSKVVQWMCQTAKAQHSLRIQSKEQGGARVPIDITFNNGFKLVPLDIMFHPTMEAFKKNARELVAACFPNSKAYKEQLEASNGKERLDALKQTLGDGYPEAVPGEHWSVCFKRRSGMATIGNLEAIETIADLVSGADNEAYTVNLDHPKICVMVEVNPVFCGMSVVRHYKDLKEFNLQRLCHPEDEASDKKDGGNEVKEDEAPDKSDKKDV
eukprot:GHVH01001114.1.p1 GENE.GHVH01001114.1~~GHVH01001114.1.p1  ORF type:complete len:336 (-),score=56.82 GHVH01001114.1:57-1064(-)